MSGSKGLQRYVPRILQDSGMIASSEVAHYTHLKLVQYVKADDIDAALRAAKAEVWREAAAVHRQADGNDCKYCLARAAQIEEGEHDDSHTSND